MPRDIVSNGSIENNSVQERFNAGKEFNRKLGNPSLIRTKEIPFSLNSQDGKNGDDEMESVLDDI